MSSQRRPGEPFPTTSENSRPYGLFDAVVEHDDAHRAVIIRLAGEIDYYTAPAVRQALDSALSTRSDSRLLVIDLERVEFIASQGLSELIIASDRVEQAGMTMRLAAANANVRMLLAVTGTGARLALRPTVADAVTEPVETADDDVEHHTGRRGHDSG